MGERIKHGWVHAKVEKGQFKDNHYEIDIGQTGAETKEDQTIQMERI